MVLGLRVHLGGLHRATQVCCTTQDARSALEKRGLPIRITLWSHHPFLSVRYASTFGIQIEGQFYSWG